MSKKFLKVILLTIFRPSENRKKLREQYISIRREKTLERMIGTDGNLSG
jgi:hypothetical protein